MFSKLFNKIKSKNTNKHKEKDKRSKSQTRESPKHHQSFGATTRWETDSSVSENENNQDQQQSNEHSIVFITPKGKRRRLIIIENPDWKFECIMASQGKRGLVSNFKTIPQLFAQFAQLFQISSSNILYCTRNTPKLDMERLLYQQLMRNDKLYVHLSGQVRDMTIQKSLPAFGFTISDSSAGAVVKRLHAGGLAELERFIFPGEVLAAIDGMSLSNLTAQEVATRLIGVRVGSRVTLRIVSPIPPLETLSEVAADAAAAAEPTPSPPASRLYSLTDVPPAELASLKSSVSAVTRIAQRLEVQLGVGDREMAEAIYKIGQPLVDLTDFQIEFHREFGNFGFADDFVQDCWHEIADSKVATTAQVTAASTSEPAEGDADRPLSSQC